MAMIAAKIHALTATSFIKGPSERVRFLRKPREL